MRRAFFAASPLRSRVGRRILLLFVVCALVPTVALSVISYQHVNRQLLEETATRLKGASKTAGMEIMLHLQSVRTALDHVAALQRDDTPAGPPEPGILGLGITSSGAFTVEAGTMRPPPVLPPAQAQHVAAGRVAILVDTSASALRILIVRQLDPASRGGQLLWAEVEPAFIWSSGGAGSLMTEDQDLCVFDSHLRPLACTRPMPLEVVRSAATGRAGSFEWAGPTGEYLSGHFTLFLGFEYGAPSWTVVVSEARSEVLAPLANFQRSFLAVVLVALGVVFLLSLGQIRRSLTPLEQLTRGTLRLSAEDFSEPVVVAGRDEFRQLADSFNAMAERLRSQLGTLRALHAFDRAALASQDRDGIVAAVRAAVEGTVGCHAAAVALADLEEPHRWQVTSLEGERLEWRELTLPARARARLDEASSPLTITEEDDDFGSLRVAAGCFRTAFVLPLHHAGEVSAALILEVDDPTTHTDRFTATQQVADQVELALSRAQAMEELRGLNRGTLLALARTVDANSPWTAGHSERVSAVAVIIGRALALSPGALDQLEVGGLLHDIGKIGVSADILDKPDTLTEAEYEAIRAHTTLGASILAPVRAYRDLLPLVRSHHELLDGSGYPDGLAGDQIPRLVRIMTVADIFDALVSKRPYRDALPLLEVVTLFREGSGVKFDTGIVESFLHMLGAGHAGIWALYPQLGEQFVPGTTRADEALLTGRMR